MTLEWRRLCSGAGLCLVLAWPASAQDLDPRAYVHVPVDTTFLVWGLGVSKGAVVTDPTLLVTDVDATATTASVGVGRCFNLLGRTAQAFVVLPATFAEATGEVGGADASVRREGLSDLRLRMSWLVRGGPAASVIEIAKAPRRTILGMSINVAAPTGEYFPDKLINLGTNRWAFRPEFAVSQPVGERWLLDAYAGVWFFTDNQESYPGVLRKSQSPLGSFQAHMSYNLTQTLWAAFDLTYYVGGRITVEGLAPTDRQSNVRVGGTLTVPVGQRHSIKFAASTGAIVRLGADFTTVSVAWQTAWVPRPTPVASTRR
jgi:hypothetical protein